jgi:hypothetical protein
MSGAAEYAFFIKRSAEREKNRLSRRVFERIREAILKLEANPRPPGSRNLRGVDDYRLRGAPIVSCTPSTTAAASSRCSPSGSEKMCIAPLS